MTKVKSKIDKKATWYVPEVAPDAPLSEVIRLIPGYDPYRDSEGFIFVEQLAQDKIDFFKDCITHVEGEMAGKPYPLEPWERAIVANIFGWVKLDEAGEEYFRYLNDEGIDEEIDYKAIKRCSRRRYRTCFVLVPRKNSKTTLAAGLILAMLFTDGENGAQCYSAAADRQQASLCFKIARKMVLNSPALLSRCNLFTRAIVLKSDPLSSYQAISSDANTKHGYNTHAYIGDELHAWPNRKLLDTLDTSMGARKHALKFCITTSDYDRPESPCNDEYELAINVRDGVEGFEDATYLPVIYEALVTDDWHSKEIWLRANPNYGKSIQEDKFLEEYKKATRVPRFENEWKRLHLNIKTEQAVRWLPVEDWKQCTGSGITDEDLLSRRCFGGMDLSNRLDMTAFSLIFPFEDRDLIAIKTWFWLPEDKLQEKIDKDRLPYDNWVEKGYLHLTKGNLIDYNVIRKFILEKNKIYDIATLSYDTWAATEISTFLGEEGIDMMPVGQNIRQMNEPCQLLEAFTVSHKIEHFNNPILNVMARHISVVTNAQGQIMPTKKNKKFKIDGLVAGLMGIAGLVHEVKETSVYDQEDHGIISLILG